MNGTEECQEVAGTAGAQEWLGAPRNTQGSQEWHVVPGMAVSPRNGRGLAAVPEMAEGVRNGMKSQECRECQEWQRVSGMKGCPRSGMRSQELQGVPTMAGGPRNEGKSKEC